MTDALADTDLETMRPNPAWDAAAHEAVVDALARDDLTYRVWGGDWCGDCRRQLPDFAAALDAAGVDPGRLHVYPVDREDGEKVGEGMAAHGVDRIPTVVVEDGSGTELARFEESEPVPIAVYLADRLS